MVMRRKRRRGMRKGGFISFVGSARAVVLADPRPVQGTFMILSWHPSPAAFCSHSELAA